MPELILIIVIIIIALIFDFGNGFNDAANSVSTVIATRVLTPFGAVLLAALLNIAGAFFFEVHVANTIGKGIVEPKMVNEYIILAGLVGAIFWVYLSTYFGIPVSGSHSLIGGYIGSSIAGAGLKAIITTGITKVIIFIFVAPLIGLLGGVLLSIVIMWAFKKQAPQKIDKIFRSGQIFSSGLYSLSHGVNDAQKTMGIIAVLLFNAGYLGKEFYVPFWVILTAHITIGLGTLAGGWNVIKTLGTKITRLRPVDGFCAEASGSLVLLGTAQAGIPVSTTHVITGAIAGVGSAKRLSAVRWKIAKNIAWAWLLTMPIAAIVGALTYYVINILV